ncbi:NAD(P)-dependent dehydrogenase (short-subunit alcohol dehydrogenase family) [Kibdelosporangium banguiense]|uniref:NAD(P)-dependent dehydrogenase (Short-subunit alcohol dehydrogenase family) n=1 Tax=Kibdelosporangium banguiense TaxID=1365924 RepID=A0ABS4T7X9_9PSEU|nr:SDR family NAD(P)-dependent oxidoreductase [Kibdelosporangium banguiense]MBP2320406.1 NAD(P)-dependent dehydrogenase (short-subunit alcohol dehydrogenase family) [Kibdelosporangium banguiense]
MTELRFDGQVAIVTGAGNGLGRHHALLLASRGARVVVNDLGGSVTGDGADAGPAEAVAREIRDQGGEAVADTHSVATREGGEVIVRTALKTYGQIDILVNNAGIVRDVPLSDMTPDDLDPMIDVHLKGAFYVTVPAWRVMREQGYGRVVNTTSSAGILGSTHKSHYGAAKTGLIGFTRVLAVEGAAHNIRVNAIAPIAATRMLAVTMAEGDNGRRLDPADLAMMHAVTSKLDPALVAPVVAFLAHEDCPVTGEIYTAGAGQVARFFTGRTKGYYRPDLSIEDVRDHLAEIRDETGYTVPEDSGGEIAQLLQAIAASPKPA